jgi:hypothetical protein
MVSCPTPRDDLTPAIIQTFRPKVRSHLGDAPRPNISANLQAERGLLPAVKLMCLASLRDFCSWHF